MRLLKVNISNIGLSGCVLFGGRPQKSDCLGLHTNSATIVGLRPRTWINFAATDLEVSRFERRDEIGMGMTELARAIDDAYHAEQLFEDLKTRSWDALNSYAHTGVLQLGRRFREHSVQPTYSDREIFEVSTTVTTCVVILASKFLAVQNHPEQSRLAERLVETYGNQ